MDKNIKSIIEGLFNDLYDIDQENNATEEIMDNINEPIIKKTLQILKLKNQKDLRALKIDDINLLPDNSINVTSGLYGKKDYVIINNLNKFLNNLFKIFKFQDETLNLNFLDVSGLTTFKGLFQQVIYPNLKIDISRWNTKNVTDLSNCFAQCYLNECDISNWDVSNVKYLNYTFYESYIHCDLSKWKFTKLEEAQHTFDSVKEINFDFSKWNTSTVLDMSYLFANINFKNKLINIKPEYIENLDVSNCKYFNYMFDHYNGPNLNLNNWIFKNTYKIFKNIFQAKSINSIIDISNWINKLSINEILNYDNFIKHQLNPLILNKIISSDVSIDQLLLLTKQKYFRDALANYKIKFEKIEDNK